MFPFRSIQTVSAAETSPSEPLQPTDAKSDLLCLPNLQLRQKYACFDMADLSLRNDGGKTDHASVSYYVTLRA